jgi:hypothetical protein
MSAHKKQPPDDPSSAPESGTVRDDTSGNNPAHPQERPALSTSSGAGAKARPGGAKQDDPPVAGEER